MPTIKSPSLRLGVGSGQQLRTRLNDRRGRKHQLCSVRAVPLLLLYETLKIRCGWPLCQPYNYLRHLLLMAQQRAQRHGANSRRRADCDSQPKHRFWLECNKGETWTRARLMNLETCRHSRQRSTRSCPPRTGHHYRWAHCHQWAAGLA